MVELMSPEKAAFVFKILLFFSWLVVVTLNANCNMAARLKIFDQHKGHLLKCGLLGKFSTFSRFFVTRFK